MLRLLLIMPVVTAVITLSTAASGAPAQRTESDLAAQVTTLSEEVRLLKLRIAELERQMTELRFTPPIVLPGISEDIALPPPTKLPPFIAPPRHDVFRDTVPWNHDTGLYVFPGLDTPGGTGKPRE